MRMWADVGRAAQEDLERSKDRAKTTRRAIAAERGCRLVLSLETRSLISKDMDPEKFYFQIDYKVAKTTSTGETREGYAEGTIFVEVIAHDFANSVDAGSIDLAAEEIALATARELARQNLAELKNTTQRMTRLEELPPVIQSVEPTVQESGVRAWLIGA